MTLYMHHYCRLGLGTVFCTLLDEVSLRRHLKFTAALIWHASPHNTPVRPVVLQHLQPFAKAQCQRKEMIFEKNKCWNISPERTWHNFLIIHAAILLRESVCEGGKILQSFKTLHQPNSTVGQMRPFNNVIPAISSWSVWCRFISCVCWWAQQYTLTGKIMY